MKLEEKEMKKDEFMGEIRRYAVLKRQQRKSADAMDVDAVNRRKKMNPGSHTGTERNAWPRIQACARDDLEVEWGMTEDWEGEDWGHIEEVGKGKGKDEQDCACAP